MLKKRVVGEVGVTHPCPINSLGKGAGETAPLKAKGYFERFPHLGGAA